MSFIDVSLCQNRFLTDLSEKLSKRNHIANQLQTGSLSAHFASHLIKPEQKFVKQREFNFFYRTIFGQFITA